jgi:hypothetical protein
MNGVLAARMLAIALLGAHGCSAMTSEPLDEIVLDDPPPICTDGSERLPEAGEGAVTYTPRYQLWADGADKARQIVLPPHCERIGVNETTGRFTFPVGTQLRKEFRLSADQVTALDMARFENDPILETRIIEKTETGWTYKTYVLDDKGTDDADDDEQCLVTAGVTGTRGTDHDVPPTGDMNRGCPACHGPGADDHTTILGFSTVQLATPLPDDLAPLFAADQAPPAYTTPGNAVQRAALGYLHANCGHCHRDGGNANRSPLRTWLGFPATAYNMTPAFLTAVNQCTSTYAATAPAGIAYLVKGGGGMDNDHVDKSAVHYRMTRDSTTPNPTHRMPPVASRVVDMTGAAAVAAWIRAEPLPGSDQPCPRLDFGLGSPTR